MRSNSSVQPKLEEKLALLMHLNDNVATVVADIENGELVLVKGTSGKKRVRSLEKVPFGFKIALSDIDCGEAIVKYGEVMGKASAKIKEGALVHIHNVEGTRGRGDLEKEARKK